MVLNIRFCLENRRKTTGKNNKRKLKLRSSFIIRRIDIKMSYGSQKGILFVFPLLSVRSMLRVYNWLLMTQRTTKRLFQLYAHFRGERLVPL